MTDGKGNATALSRTARIAADVALALALALIEATALVDEAPHEWLGITAFALVATHVVLSRKRVAALVKGRKTVGNVLQISVDVLLAVAIVGQVASSVVLSEHALSWLPVIPGAFWARTAHLLFGYWSFVLAFVHMGLHVRRLPRAIAKSAALKWIARVAITAAAVAGAHFFFSMGIPSYMFLQTQFAFADFGTPLWLRCFQWLCIGTALCAGTCFVASVKRYVMRKMQ